VQVYEVTGRTVVEGAPDSAVARAFRDLAAKVWEDSSRVIPTPIEDLAELEALYKSFMQRGNAFFVQEHL